MSTACIRAFLNLVSGHSLGTRTFPLESPITDITKYLNSIRCNYFLVSNVTKSYQKGQIQNLTRKKNNFKKEGYIETLINSKKKKLMDY